MIHVITYMNLNSIMLGKKKDAKGYILYSHVYITTLWKRGQNSGGSQGLGVEGGN